MTMMGVWVHSRSRLGHFQTVEIGQAEIEEHHVGIPRGRLHQALLRSGRLHQAVALGLKRDPQKTAHLRLVFDQEYEFFFFRHGCKDTLNCHPARF